MMYSAMNADKGPYIIRYPRGYGEGCDWKAHEYTSLESGKGEKLVEGKDVAFVCAGPLSYRAMEAAQKAAKEFGKQASVYNIRFIKPIDTNLLTEIAKTHSCVITVEDGTVIGGLHGAVAEFMAEHFPGVKVIPAGIPDIYVSQGTQNELREECGITTDKLYETLSSCL